MIFQERVSLPSFEEDRRSHETSSALLTESRKRQKRRAPACAVCTLCMLMANIDTVVVT